MNIPLDEIYLFLLYITAPSVIFCFAVHLFFNGNRKKKEKNLDKTVPTTLGCIVFPIACINVFGFVLLLLSMF